VPATIEGAFDCGIVNCTGFQDASVLNGSSCCAESSFIGSPRCRVGFNEMDSLGNMLEFSFLLTPPSKITYFGKINLLKTVDFVRRENGHRICYS
jgi:hypothetical protein